MFGIGTLAIDTEQIFFFCRNQSFDLSPSVNQA